MSEIVNDNVSLIKFVLSIVLLFVVIAISLADEVVCPPGTSNTFLQTNGPNGYLKWGDWWTSGNANGGNQPHQFNIYVPCTVDSDFTIQVQLYDPESFQTGSEIDEEEGTAWDSTTFRIVAPDGSTEIARQIYPPIAGTSEQWNDFASFSVRNYGCGIYHLYSSTFNDDQNAFRIKIVEADPDGIANSGDEINIAPVESSYQHNGDGCSTFWFYVPDKPELRLSNFDMDDDGSTSAISATYTDPDGNTIEGTTSGNKVWNNGGGVPFPPPGGDVFSNPTSGWWSAELCVDNGNQYVFYAEGALFLDYLPNHPDVSISKDDGVTQAFENTNSVYTIIVKNNGDGPALNVTVTDTLPTSASYVSSTGNSTYTLNDSLEMVTWNLGLLLPGESDSVALTVNVKSGASSPLKNTAYVSCTDVLFNEYSGIHDSDEDEIIPAGSIGDLVWDDSNGNGQHDSGEPGLANITVNLITAAGDTVDSQTTNDSGNYLFRNVAAGNYTVDVDDASLSAGYSCSTGNEPLSITFTEGSFYMNADFGYHREFDFGDAPDPGFPTLLANNGARHVIVSGYYLGSSIDSENDGQPTASANGDDSDGNNDDDGVQFISPLVQGGSADVKVTASTGGYLNAWLDFNGDGDWDDAGEQIFTDTPVTGGINTLHFSVPFTGSPDAARIARFRFSSVEGLSYTGLAPDGEVEGYLVDVLIPVELVSFTAAQVNENVKLEWTTQTETENLGFYIYRAETENGDFQKLSAELITGAGSSEAEHNYNYIDENVSVGNTYYYKLADVNYSGQVTMHEAVTVSVQPPTEYSLGQNYPNPFNPETNIQFKLKKAGFVELAVYNLKGQMVRKLVAKRMNAGIHDAKWNGRDNAGNIAPSGIYLYTLRVNDFKKTGRMLYLR